MEVCSVCGKNSFMSEKYGDALLCKVCSIKILSPTWRSKTYLSNDEIGKQKEKVIKLANTSRFPTEVIEEISKFFESKKIDGLIKIFDGYRGQILTVCETHCIIDTVWNFNYKETEKAYIRLMTSKKRGNNSSLDMLDGVINTQTAAGIIGEVVGGMLPGGKVLAKQIKNVGMSVAMNAISKQLTGGKGETEEKRIVLNIRSGERFIKYSDYDIVKFMEPVGKEEYGFIKLQNSKHIHESDEDVLFFFGNRTETKKEASQLYEFIKKKISENKKELSESMSRREDNVIVQKAPESSTADEILKYKQLLDMGAITQEEYDAKKKQLLGL